MNDFEQKTESKKVLIFGASGFVGHEICKYLNQHSKFEVYPVGGVRRKYGFKYNIDITNPSEFEQLREIGEVEVVINAAGLAHQFSKNDPKRFFEVNVEGAKNICKWSREISANKMILLSSVAVYGDYGKESVDENFECRPKSAYGESKLLGERKSLEIFSGEDVSVFILRLSTVIGENDPGNMERLIKAIFSGRFFLVGEGRNKKSFIYKTDIGSAVFRLLEGDCRGTHTLNLSGGELTVREVVETIYDGLGKRAPRIKLPVDIFEHLFNLNKKIFKNKLIEKVGIQFEKWTSDDVYSANKISEKFNIFPQTDLLEGLRRQIEEFRKRIG